MTPDTLDSLSISPEHLSSKLAPLHDLSSGFYPVTGHDSHGLQFHNGPLIA